MAQPYLSQISMFGGNFAPVGYAFCNGQLLSIAQNTALYALIGTTFGGDGVNTFALPNLQSRLPVHQGQGAGLSTYVLGQTAGTQAVTIDSTTMRSHSHTFSASTANATAAAISNSMVPATPTVSGAALYATPSSPSLEQQALAGLANAGGSVPHSNLMPSLCVSFIIALEGIFPSQN